MERLLTKYAGKLADAGLVAPEDAYLAGLDDELVWSRAPVDPVRRGVLEGLFDALNINSLCCAVPAEPFRGIVAYLAREAGRQGWETAAIQPQDCETRTFLHDLPVVAEFSTSALAAALKRRKTVLVHDPDGPPTIVTYGSVSPEQAFVFFSSVCFSCFVKFFVDFLQAAKQGRVEPAFRAAFEAARSRLAPYPSQAPSLARAPFPDSEAIYAALREAGRKTVEYGLVDSYFGNISYLSDGILYISQTGSSLDELEGRVDPCPLDDSSTVGLTASSELSAHVETLARTGLRALLHGHPRFSVILSMDCDEPDCPTRGECHLRCPAKRAACGAPIAPGEVGTGQYGLCHTLPAAMEQNGAAIVYGHGLFVAGPKDFNEPFARLLGVESACREEYFRRVDEALRRSSR
jgi:ribulose-5-phosphate 4-epimerase/fuculose-1-phosphate aldolase